MVVYLVRSEEAIIKEMWLSKAIMGCNNMKFGIDIWINMRSQRKPVVKRIRNKLRKRECTVRSQS